MNKFTAGVATGISSLALAVPLIAQIAGAQDAEFTAATATELPVPTQECATSMVNLEEYHLAHFDKMNEKRKQQMQTRIDSLNTIASISDDTQREEAFKKMHEDMRETMDDIEQDEEITALMDATREACGDMMMIGGHAGPGFFKEVRMMKFDLAEELGLTKEELKAELDSGKTIEQIAEDKGVELPARPAFKLRGNIAEKLGMTETELKAELESGKTIEEIAEEKGVELPARPEMGKRVKMFFRGAEPVNMTE